MEAGVWLEIIDRIFLFFIGIPGNFCVILVYRKRKTGGSTRLYIIAVALVDLAICLSSPALIYHKLMKRRYTNVIFCKLFVYGYISLVYLSLLFMVVIAVDRYIKVCHSTRQKTSPRRAKIIIIICTAVCLAMNTPFIVFLSLKRQDNGDVRCGQSSGGILQGVITGLAYLLSFVVAFGSYGMIYRNMKIHTRVRANLFGIRNHGKECPMVPVSVSGTIDGMLPPVAQGEARLGTSGYKASTPHSMHRLAWSDSNANSMPNSSALSQNSNPSSEGRTSEQVNSGSNVPYRKTPLDKTTKMMLAVTVIYFFTWIPEVMATTFLRESIPEAMMKHVVVDLLISFLRDLLAVNHVINPVVYGLVNKGFRRDLFKLFRC